MPRRARRPSETGIYHIVMRGINKQQIFEDDADYRKFIRVLKKEKVKYGFELFAYCLMPNHIHLLLRQGPAPLELIFKGIGASFVYWYNVRYERVGHLFQDRFRSEPIRTERHFLSAVRYIHLNPVKAGICQRPGEYAYSSYLHYFDKHGMVDNEMLLSYVTVNDFAAFHKAADSVVFCEPEDFCKPRVTDERAKELMAIRSGCRNSSEFQCLKTEDRKQYIAMLRKEGVSIRQASRLTGVSVGIIRYIS